MCDRKCRRIYNVLLPSVLVLTAFVVHAVSGTPDALYAGSRTAASLAALRPRRVAALVKRAAAAEDYDGGRRSSASDSRPRTADGAAGNQTDFMAYINDFNMQEETSIPEDIFDQQHIGEVVDNIGVGVGVGNVATVGIISQADDAASTEDGVTEVEADIVLESHYYKPTNADFYSNINNIKSATNNDNKNSNNRMTGSSDFMAAQSPAEGDNKENLADAKEEVNFELPALGRRHGGRAHGRSDREFAQESGSIQYALVDEGLRRWQLEQDEKLKPARNARNDGAEKADTAVTPAKQRRKEDKQVAQPFKLSNAKKFNKVAVKRYQEPPQQEKPEYDDEDEEDSSEDTNQDAIKATKKVPADQQLPDSGQPEEHEPHGATPKGAAAEGVKVLSDIVARQSAIGDIEESDNEQAIASKNDRSRHQQHHHEHLQRHAEVGTSAISEMTKKLENPTDKITDEFATPGHHRQHTDLTGNRALAVVGRKHKRRNGQIRNGGDGRRLHWLAPQAEDAPNYFGMAHVAGGRLNNEKTAGSTDREQQSQEASTSPSTAAWSTMATPTALPAMELESAFERHKALRRKNHRYGHRTQKKKYKDYLRQHAAALQQGPPTGPPPLGAEPAKSSAITTITVEESAAINATPPPPPYLTNHTHSNSNNNNKHTSQPEHNEAGEVAPHKDHADTIKDDGEGLLLLQRRRSERLRKYHKKLEAEKLRGLPTSPIFAVHSSGGGGGGNRTMALLERRQQSARMESPRKPFYEGQINYYLETNDEADDDEAAAATLSGDDSSPRHNNDDDDDGVTGGSLLNKLQQASANSTSPDGNNNNGGGGSGMWQGRMLSPALRSGGKQTADSGTNNNYNNYGYGNGNRQQQLHSHRNHRTHRQRQQMNHQPHYHHQHHNHQQHHLRQQQQHDHTHRHPPLNQHDHRDADAGEQQQFKHHHEGKYGNHSAERQDELPLLHHHQQQQQGQQQQRQNPYKRKLLPLPQMTTTAMRKFTLAEGGHSSSVAPPPSAAGHLAAQAPSRAPPPPAISSRSSAMEGDGSGGVALYRSPHAGAMQELGHQITEIKELERYYAKWPHLARVQMQVYDEHYREQHPELYPDQYEHEPHLEHDDLDVDDDDDEVEEEDYESAAELEEAENADTEDANLPPYIKKYRRRNQALLNLLEGTLPPPLPPQPPTKRTPPQQQKPSTVGHGGASAHGVSALPGAAAMHWSSSVLQPGPRQGSRNAQPAVTVVRLDDDYLKEKRKHYHAHNKNGNGNDYHHIYDLFAQQRQSTTTTPTSTTTTTTTMATTTMAGGRGLNQGPPLKSAMGSAHLASDDGDSSNNTTPSLTNNLPDEDFTYSRESNESTDNDSDSGGGGAGDTTMEPVARGGGGAQSWQKEIETKSNVPPGNANGMTWQIEKVTAPAGATAAATASDAPNESAATPKAAIFKLPSYPAISGAYIGKPRSRSAQFAPSSGGGGGANYAYARASTGSDSYGGGGSNNMNNYHHHYKSMAGFTALNSANKSLGKAGAAIIGGTPATTSTERAFAAAERDRDRERDWGRSGGGGGGIMPTPQPTKAIINSFVYHRVVDAAPRLVGAGLTGFKQRLPFVAITDRRLETSNRPAMKAEQQTDHEQNQYPLP